MNLTAALRRGLKAATWFRSTEGPDCDDEEEEDEDEVEEDADAETGAEIDADACSTDICSYLASCWHACKRK